MGLARLLITLLASAAAGAADGQTQPTDGSAAMFNELATLARDGMARRLASRKMMQDMLRNETDPEMATYLENSIKAVDRQIARDREWIELGDPKADSATSPITEWLAAQEARAARDDAQGRRLDSSGSSESGRTFSTTRARSAGDAVGDGRFLQSWTTVVVDSTGEVLVDDPLDRIEAQIEDIAREQSELETRAKREIKPAEQKRTRDALSALERRLAQVVAELARLTDPTRVGKAQRWDGRSVCSSGRRNVAVLGCEFLATNVPLTLPGGDPIVVERVRLEIDEERGRPKEWRLTYWWRYSSAGPTDEEPEQGVNGPIRIGADGQMLLVYMRTDENGNELEMGMPATVTSQDVTVSGADFVDGHPLSFTMKRDPSNFLLLDPSHPSQSLGR